MADRPLEGVLRVIGSGGAWRLEGTAAGDCSLVNDYLAYLADRNYSPRTTRAYAFDLLSFSRWLAEDSTGIEKVTTDTLLRYLAACREVTLAGQHGGNVVSIRSGRASG
jgi:site-specific recombinase XerD